jgi:hypothetical protein
MFTVQFRWRYDHKGAQWGEWLPYSSAFLPENALSMLARLYQVNAIGNSNRLYECRIVTSRYKGIPAGWEFAVA